MRTVLAGDVGGTKTILGLFEADSDSLRPLASASFRSLDYPDFGDMLRRFLATQGAPSVASATIGVAGPVRNGRCQLTKLPWLLDEADLARATGIPKLTLLNDLVTTAHALAVLPESDLLPLKSGTMDPQGAKAVIAPGTGLGEALLVWDGAGHTPHPTEGGHAAFGPGSPVEDELLRFLRPTFGHVSYDLVCSGRGFPYLYAFLKESGRERESDAVGRQLKEAADPAPVIVRAALEEKDPLAMATVDLFCEILGNEAGNLALKTLSTGGVYLGGGIPPKILPALRKGLFAEAFGRKGDLAGFLSDVPVLVIANDQASLLGAAHHARRPLGQGSG